MARPARKATSASQSSGGRYASSKSRLPAVGGCPHVLAQVGRADSIARVEQGIEAPQAAEARSERHLRDRQRRVGQQTLRQQQALCLGILDGRDAELGLEHAPQVAIGHAQARRDRIEPAVVRQPVFDQAGGRLREPRLRVDARVAGGELRAAAQTGPEAVALRRRGADVEAAVLAARAPCRAHRPAVDAGGSDTDEHPSVEARIVRGQRAVTAFRVEQHGPHYPARRPSCLAVFGHGSRRRSTSPSMRRWCPAVSARRPLPRSESVCQP